MAEIWDDFLRRTTTCSADVMPGFGLSKPVIIGSITNSEIATDADPEAFPASTSSVFPTEQTRSGAVSNRKNASSSYFTNLSAQTTPSHEPAPVRARSGFKTTPKQSSLRSNKSSDSLHRRQRPESETSINCEGNETRGSNTDVTTKSGNSATGTRKWRKMWKIAYAERRNVPGDMAKETKPIEKLRRFLRSILIIVEVCLALKRYVQNGKKDQLTLMEMQLNLQEDLDKKLTFNPHYYSASYVANKGSSKLKKMLAIAPEARTKKHIKMIHTLVQNKNAFSKHPAHIRLKMCQVMIYQSYESRRVIIKQGHPPSAFYIVLSGTCLINTKEQSNEEGGETTQTVNELKEGEVFGEVALLNKTTRTASVVCKDHVELLVIYKDDFDAIIRGPIYKQREEVVQYLKELTLLKNWPVDLLTKASIANFQYQYYRPGAVVVKDNMTSNFLVFIKSGECRVVCTLQVSCDEFATKPRSRSINSRTLLPLLDENARTEILQSRSMSLVPGKSRFHSTFRNNLPAIRDEDNLSDVDEKTPRQRRESGVRHEFKSDYDVKNSYNNVKRRLTARNLDALSNLKRPHRTSLALPHIHENTLSVPNRLELPHVGATERLSRMRRSIRASSIFEDTPYAIAKKKTSPLISEKWKKSSNSEKTKLPSSRSEPKFAQIAILPARRVFGMEELMKRTRLRLSLLSDGAECIFISKKFFQRHAGAETLRTVNGMVGRYPTEEFIRHQLEEQSEWSSFRKEVVRGVLEKRDEKLDLPSILQAH
ncbi:uncharacterized protein LOC143469669 isoform X1 [Clavelina lepadiformis]|uniref:uncharacterized protein LOC143469669 isoform X1 n=1 Tax=Clavelina lepadiformis TaxID=159417 RepID=UPI00404380D3